MEFIPRYPQPFTLADAFLFDPSVISEEIGRLQNSLTHLRRTQDDLRGYINSSSDVAEDKDVSNALRENELTIASQDERIFMLKLALTHHGIPTSSLSENQPRNPASESTCTQASASERVDNGESNGLTDDDGDGVYL